MLQKRFKLRSVEIGWELRHPHQISQAAVPCCAKCHCQQRFLVHLDISWQAAPKYRGSARELFAAVDSKMWLLWTSLHRAMPMQIANGHCQCRLCRAISEVQVFAFTRFLSECCSFNHKSKALQASPSTLAALPVRGFLGPKTVQVAGSQVMWYLRFFF